VNSPRLIVEALSSGLIGCSFSCQRVYSKLGLALILNAVSKRTGQGINSPDTGPESIVPERPPVVKAPRPERLPDQAPVPELEKQKPSEVQVAVLDLRKRGSPRGQNRIKPGDLILPKGRLKLSIYLPFGSEVGQHEVRISGRKKQVATKGLAVVRNRITVLDVEVDTSAFEAGNHSLAIRQVGWGWYRYSVSMR
jgi:hypothetical protein